MNERIIKILLFVGNYFNLLFNLLLEFSHMFVKFYFQF
jgi:hypothetical protein